MCTVFVEMTKSLSSLTESTKDFFRVCTQNILRQEILQSTVVIDNTTKKCNIRHRFLANLATCCKYNFTPLFFKILFSCSTLQLDFKQNCNKIINLTQKPHLKFCRKADNYWKQSPNF